MNDILNLLGIQTKLVRTLLKVAVIAIPATLLGYCGGSVVTEIKYEKVVKVVKEERDLSVTKYTDLKLSVDKANNDALILAEKSRTEALAKEDYHKAAIKKANQQLKDERKKYENRELYMLNNVGVGLYPCAEETGGSDPDSAYKMSGVRDTRNGGNYCRLPEQVRVGLIKLATEAQAIVAERNTAVDILNSIKKEQSK